MFCNLDSLFDLEYQNDQRSPDEVKPFSSFQENENDLKISIMIVQCTLWNKCSRTW